MLNLLSDMKLDLINIAIPCISVGTWCNNQSIYNLIDYWIRHMMQLMTLLQCYCVQYIYYVILVDTCTLNFLNKSLMIGSPLFLIFQGLILKCMPQI